MLTEREGKPGVPVETTGTQKARKPGLLDEARQIGLSYGHILIEAGLPLPGAVEAYIGFRKTIDETTRQASMREALPVEEALDACGQVHSLGDQVLIGIAAAYEDDMIAATAQ